MSEREKLYEDGIIGYFFNVQTLTPKVNYSFAT